MYVLNTLWRVLDKALGRGVVGVELTGEFVTDFVHLKVVFQMKIFCDTFSRRRRPTVVARRAKFFNPAIALRKDQHIAAFRQR